MYLLLVNGNDEYLFDVNCNDKAKSENEARRYLIDKVSSKVAVNAKLKVCSEVSIFKTPNSPIDIQNHWNEKSIKIGYNNP